MVTLAETKGQDRVAGDTAFGYILAAFLAVAALIVSLIAFGGVAGVPAAALLVLAVAVSAYRDGLGPGLAATAIAAAGLLVVRLAGSDPVDLGRIGLVVARGAVLSLLCEGLHRARRRALGSHDAGARALARSEQRFARIFHGNPVPLLLTRLSDRRTVDASASFCAMTGYTRDELIGRTTAELGLYADPAARTRVLAAIAAGGRVDAAEAQIVTRGGAVRDVLLTAEAFELDGERHALGIWVDITERKRAEARTIESEQRFRQLAENVREVFYLYDRDQRAMLYVSPHFEAVYGRPVRDAYASIETWIDAIHPDDRARVLGRADARSDEPYEISFRIVRPDGSVRWLAGRMSPIVERDGKVARIAGVTEDVTERRRLEEQLFHAEKMESIGVLAGGVAHDFNNVLTVILSCAELLRRDTGDLERELVDDILSAVERAQSLTRQLLVFSRREVAETQVIDLNASIADAEKMLRRLIGEDVVLTTSLDPAVGHIRIDPGHLVQVLMNLAVNARDAMPRGGRLRVETGDVTVEAGARLARVLARGRYARLLVTDDGCGMAVDVQARIFEPFFTTKGPGRGTGMGLAVAHGIVRQAGGFIEVASAPGAGTSFAIYLPVVEAAVERTGDHALAPPIGHETVLVVEDADDLRRLTTRTLRQQGYRVLEAGRGEVGLELVRVHARELALLITDVVMPGMDGRQLAEAATRIAPGLQVLYTSGYTDDAVVRHGVARAEVAFLQKPFTPRTLVHKVREVLDSAA